MSENSKANTVWLMRDQSAIDITDAEKYGCITRVFDRRVSPHDVAAQIKFIQEQVFPVAGRWDFILNVGPAIMVSTFVATWVHRFGFCRQLVWDGRKDRQCYQIIPVRPDPQNDPIAELERRKAAHEQAAG